MLAPAKLTRSLRIVGRRADGYHLLESEMVALDLADELEIEPLDGSDGRDADGPGGGGGVGAGESRLEVLDEVRWVGTAIGEPAGQDAGAWAGAVAPVPLGPENLVLRALREVGRRAAVTLRKRIPPGAGLGGGSSDAAAVLRWAGVDDPELAVRLGADVPFCLAGGRALVRGIGDSVEALAPEPLAVLLVTPPVGVSTVAAYRAFDELGPGAPDPFRRNDLEHAALVVEPRLLLWRDLLADVSGHRPQLAGSGSSWFVELPDGALPARGRHAGIVHELTKALAAAGVRGVVTVAAALDATALDATAVDGSDRASGAR
ncbi:MAG TPA: 4-(cytidine 5'-diphospho)-2-C-methyl-D-erythritol kinase [Acidimicrobiales bacterium]|nr:4-(cytidine 5'-diphospho)-2-C-methyl-D-erythritol kinase [Acidimicrobiales bacterium]